MFEKPNDEHQWLDQLIGDWTCESECDMGPDQPPMKSSGTESVRSLGGLWTVGEGTFGVGEMASVSIMTLGYDSKKKKYVGTFIVSMMSYLWPYEGQLDDTKTKLVLDSVGPSFSGDGSMAKYQDTIEFIDPNHRVLSSRMLLPNGQWKKFMEGHYYRVT